MSGFGREGWFSKGGFSYWEFAHLVHSLNKDKSALILMLIILVKQTGC
jgi:hypothetical protein